MDESLVLPKIKKVKEILKKILSTTQTPSSFNPTNTKEINPLVKKHVHVMINKTESVKKGMVQHDMGYDIMEDIKKTKANFSLFGLCNFSHQIKKLLEAFDPQPRVTPETIETNTEVNESSIGGKSKSQTLPFLLSFEIFSYNVHNCLVDYGASSNVMPLSICKKINIQPTPSPCRIIQLDKSTIKVIGEMKDVLI